MKRSIYKTWLFLKYILFILTNPQFLLDYIKYNKKSDEKLKFIDIMPIYENTSSTAFDTHYVYHPAWASRVIKKINPSKHIDISSTVNFSSQLSAFIDTEFYDYRPANMILSNLKTGRADLTNLHFKSNSIESLSCMHTVEHIGLGRYGDEIDAFGDIKAMKELERVVAKNGNLLFVVPVGKATVRFNGMRIYSFEKINNQFQDMELREFQLIPDNALQVGMIENPSSDIVNAQTYGCGCFWFVKK